MYTNNIWIWEAAEVQYIVYFILVLFSVLSCLLYVNTNELTL